MTFVIFAILFIVILVAVLYLLYVNSNLIRLLTLGYITNVIIALICFYGVISGNQSYIDIALIYALISPVATLALIRFLKREK